MNLNSAIMNRDKRYSEISSLEELKRERASLETLIEHKEMQLKEDVADFRDSLRPVRILTSLVSNITVLYPFFTMGKKIIQSVVSFFKGDDQSLKNEETTINNTQNQDNQ